MRQGREEAVSMGVTTVKELLGFWLQLGPGGQLYFWASACMSAGLEWEGTPSTTAMTILLLLHIVITYLKDDFGLVAQSYIYDD